MSKHNEILKAIVNYSTSRFHKTDPVRNVNNLTKTMGKNIISNAGNREFKVSPMNIRVNAVKKQLTNSNSGEFLYIIYYNTLSGKFTTEFIKPNPVFEYGTKHFQMRKKNLENDVIFASGELKMDAKGNVRYNMLSGTYMMKIMMFYAVYPKPFEQSNMDVYYKKMIPQILKMQNPAIKKVTYTSTDIVTPLLKKTVTLQELRNTGARINNLSKLPPPPVNNTPAAPIVPLIGGGFASRIKR
jgi:hypothetical protein